MALFGNRPYTYEESVAVFWQKVDKSAGPDGCWIWTGAFRYDGYGHVAFMRKQSAAHQRAYRIAKGDIPKGMWVLHSCDNRKCVNPAHLRLGTRAENMQDAIDRKRLHTDGLQPKLSPDTVRSIRAEFKKDERGHSNAYALARKHGVHRNTVLAAVKGLWWRHVK